MTRRAIIIVPGFGKTLQGDATTRLGHALCHYTDGYKVRQDRADDLSGGKASYHATDRETGYEVTVDLYEAYWGDLIPSREAETPHRRMVRGWFLIRYWLLGGVGQLLHYGRSQANGAVWALSLAGLFLAIWYLNVLVLALTAIANGDTDLTTGLCTLPGVSCLCAELSDHAEAWSTASVSLFLIGFVGLLGWVETFASLSDFVMSYLRDDPTGEDGIGIRALTRHRLLAVLDQVCAVEDYDEIFVVGHSLGGVIAADALAEYGKGSERITLITWGSALGLLMAKEPKIETEIAKFYDNPTRLQNWVDVAVRGDLLGADVPRPRQDPTKRNGPRRARIYPDTVWIERPKGLTIWQQGQVHEFFFRAEDAIVMLIQRAQDLPQPGASNRQGGGGA